MKGSKITSLFLTFAMLLSLVVIPASAAEGDLLISPNPTTQEATFPDVADHWGKDSVERWAGYGIFKGDETGAFNPDKQMTRAEFATMLVNLMGYTEKAENSFADVDEEAWYADAILKLAAAGIMQGDGVNANPNSPISREETVVLLCRAMNIQPSPNASVDFADKDQVASWAQDAVAALAERGMINGMGDNQFAPALEINRVSVATMVDNIVAAYVVDDTQELTGEIKGVVIIAANSNVTIKDATLSENIIVAPKAADATVALTGKTVAQNVIVSADSASLSVEKDAAAGNILVEAPKGTVSVAGKAGSVMTGEGASAANVSVAKGASVDAVALSGADAKLDVTGTVKEVQVSSTASNTEVVANSGAKIDKMETSADNVAVSGKGTIKDMTVTAGEGVEVSKDTKVDKIENKGDAPVDVGGKPVEPGKDTSNQGGSSSDSSSGGSSTPSYKYNVKIEIVGDGAVEVGPSETNDPNAEVEITYEPAAGWKFAELTLTKPAGSKAEIKGNKFTMDVEGTYTVNVTFVQPLTKFEVAVFADGTAAFNWLKNDMGFNITQPQYDKDFGNINAENPWLFIAGKRGDGFTAGIPTSTLTIKANGTAQTPSWSNSDSTSGSNNVYSLFVNTGAEGTSQLKFDGAAATIEVSVVYEGVTYTASCEYKAPNAGTIYTVSFNSNGGSAVSPQKIEENGKANKPADPTKTGYTFNGWHVGSADGTAWDFTTSTVTGDTNLYAKWTANKYGINYQPNVSSLVMMETVVEYDKDVTLNSEILGWSRPGYTLTGWNTKADGTGTQYALGATVRNLVPSGNITLFAQWTLTPITTAEQLQEALEKTTIPEIDLTGKTIGSTSAYGEYTVDRKVTLKGGTIYGSFVLKASSEATFEGVTFNNKGDESGGGHRNAINAYTDKLTVKGCTFNAGSAFANGIMILPSKTSVAYTITGNTFNGYNQGVKGWSTSAILISTSYPMSNKPFFEAGTATNATSTNMNDTADQSIINGNTFDSCTNNYTRNDYGSGTAIYCTAISNGGNTRFATAADAGAKYYITGPVTRGYKPAPDGNDVEADLVIKSGTEVVITEGSTLTIDTGEQNVTVKGTLTNNGTLNTNGKLIVEGTLTNNGTLTGLTGLTDKFAFTMANFNAVDTREEQGIDQYAGINVGWTFNTAPTAADFKLVKQIDIKVYADDSLIAHKVGYSKGYQTFANGVMTQYSSGLGMEETTTDEFENITTNPIVDFTKGMPTKAEVTITLIDNTTITQTSESFGAVETWNKLVEEQKGPVEG